MDECIEFIHDDVSPTQYRIHPPHSPIMTLNPKQLQFFKENYASVLVDEMQEDDTLINYVILMVAEEMEGDDRRGSV